MQVEFLALNKYERHTGIGRYVSETQECLQPFASVSLKQPISLPGSHKWSFLCYLPIGIRNHVAGSIVHFPQIMGCAMMLWRRLRPSVVTVHDLGMLELPEEEEMLDPIARQILRLSLAGLKHADIVIAVSEFTRQGVIKHLRMPGDRVVTIHSGINHKLFRPMTNARERLVSRYPQLAPIASGPWLLYVGSELPRKNVGTLLHSLALVREEAPRVNLIKVGSAGSDRHRSATIKAVHEMNLQSAVHFFDGPIPDRHLPLFYNAADVLVHPSKLEGFGFPLLEAMACGTPAIAAAEASLPEIADDAAFLFASHDYQRLSEAIIRMLHDTELRETLEKRALKRAAGFSWRDTARQTAAVYARLESRYRLVPATTDEGEVRI